MITAAIALILLLAGFLLDYVLMDEFPGVDFIYVVPIAFAAVQLTALETSTIVVLAMLLNMLTIGVAGDDARSVEFSTIGIAAIGVAATFCAYVIDGFRSRFLVAWQALMDSPLAYADFSFPDFKLRSQNSGFRRLVERLGGRATNIDAALGGHAAGIVRDLAQEAINYGGQQQRNQIVLHESDGRDTFWMIDCIPVFRKEKAMPESVAIFATEVTAAVKQARNREAALGMTSAVRSSLLLGDTVRAVLDNLSHIMESDAGALLLVEDGYWAGKAGWGRWPDEDVSLWKVPYDSFTTASAAVGLRKPIPLDDAIAELADAGIPPELPEAGAAIIVPLTAGSTAIGVAVLTESGAHSRFREEQLDFATVIGSHAGLALMQAIKYESGQDVRVPLQPPDADAREPDA